LIKQGLPDNFTWPFFVFAALATGFLFSVLGVLGRCVQLICGADYHVIRSRLSLSFIPFFVLWMTIREQDPPKEPAFDSVPDIFVPGALYAFVAMSVLLAAIVVSIIIALVVVFWLRRKARPAADIRRGRILAHAVASVVIGFLVVVSGFAAFDYSLVGSITEYPVRTAIGKGARNVFLSPFSSEAVIRLDVPQSSVLHAGFGVPKETFDVIPYDLTYTVSVSSSDSPPQEWISEKVGVDTSDTWKDFTLDLSSHAGTSLELRMKADYADSSFLLEAISLSKYYALHIFGGRYPFDARLRTAVWIKPRAMPLRTPEEKNVIVIGIDALRPDHMSAYGYERETTPNIDRFAKDAAIFNKCFTAAPWTLPSFFSMVTSTYPSVHQYGTNFHGEIRQETRTAAIWKIGTISPDYNIKTLAETLREQGYYTAAFVNNPFLSTQNEFDRGFDEYNHYGPTSVEGVEQVLSWLDRHRNEKFFLFFHVMDPHDFSIKGSAIYELPQRYGGPGDKALEMETNKYDTGVNFCDEQMAEFLEGMKWLGLGHHSLVILTSDHGEELHDRGGTGHGHSLNNELLRVPLIVRLPGGSEDRMVFDERISTLDIAPTILDVLDMPVPPYYQGQSLAPLFAGEELSARPIFAEALGSGHEKKAVIMGDHKMIYTATSNKFELYNLKNDPKESKNLILKAPAIESTMVQALQPFVEQSRAGFHVALNPPEGLDMCEGRILPGTFLRVTPFDLTESKIFRASDGSEEILFRLRGEHGTSGFFFEVYPPWRDIHIELTGKDGEPATDIFVGSDSDEPRRSPVKFDRQILRALGTEEPEMDKPGLYVWLKETGREAKSVEIDTKTKERLEALGYLGN
jgi:arylsulfatase A-like enzyme